MDSGGTANAEALLTQSLQMIVQLHQVLARMPISGLALMGRAIGSREWRPGLWLRGPRVRERWDRAGAPRLRRTSSCSRHGQHRAVVGHPHRGHQGNDPQDCTRTAAAAAHLGSRGAVRPEVRSPRRTRDPRRRSGAEGRDPIGGVEDEVERHYRSVVRRRVRCQLRG